MKKILIIFLLLFVFCVPVSANTVTISDDLFNATLNTSSPIKSIFQNRAFPLSITTEDNTIYTFRAKPITDKILSIHHIPLDINNDNFLDEWKNNILNNINGIYYIETIPIKKGIIYITKDSKKSYIYTIYIKNNLLFSTTILVKNPISKNDLINLAYQSIESIYPK